MITRQQFQFDNLDMLCKHSRKCSPRKPLCSASSELACRAASQAWVVLNEHASGSGGDAAAAAAAAEQMKTAASHLQHAGLSQQAVSRPSEFLTLHSRPTAGQKALAALVAELERCGRLVLLKACNRFLGRWVGLRIQPYSISVSNRRCRQAVCPWWAHTTMRPGGVYRS